MGVMPPLLLLCRTLMLANRTDPQCTPENIANARNQIPHWTSQAPEGRWLHIGEEINITADRIKEEEAAAAAAAALTTTPAPCDSEPGPANEFIIPCPNRWLRET
ncbi:uncharacterized protein LOC129598157 [Paramacrobiotus metropolitanus]|uniref:uncharacterized protein LOC129598157 n=1 Tax=Paramacrobiotus metropolitanus TaxID=2943436 RepID=UPI002445C383|nr:uncharacterized protein LOC129598157 [Paramacrobiotus metropolitanus]